MLKDKKLINIIGFLISVIIALLAYFAYMNFSEEPEKLNKIIKKVEKKIEETSKIVVKEKPKILINANSNFINKKLEEKQINDSEWLLRIVSGASSKWQKNNLEKNISIAISTIWFFRNWDKTKISATIYNNTKEEKSLKIKFDSKDIEVNKIQKNLIVWAKSNEEVSFWIKNWINKKKDVKFILFALWKTKKNSDIIQKKISFKQHPSLNPIFLKWGIAKKGIKQNFKINIPENTDLEKSKVKISFSTNLDNINNEVWNYLNSYPYWKINFDLGKLLKSFEKYRNNWVSNFAFSIWTIHNREKRFSIWGIGNKYITREFVLDDIVQYKEDYIELTSYVLSWKDIFTNLTLEVIPKNKFLLEENNEKIKIFRKIFEIKSGKEIIDSNYELNKKYKVKIKINIDKKYLWNSNNLVLENYIPSGFILEKNIASGESANWEKIKYLSDKIIVENNINLWSELEFEYIFIPKFLGDYIFPPATIYFKNNYNVKANNKFEKIFVK